MSSPPKGGTFTWTKSWHFTLFVLLMAWFINGGISLLLQIAMFVPLRAAVAPEFQDLLAVSIKAIAFLLGGSCAIYFLKRMQGGTSVLTLVRGRTENLRGAVLKTLAFAVGGFLIVRGLSQLYLLLMLPHVQSIGPLTPGSPLDSLPLMVMGTLTIFGAPLIEETLFRGFVYNMLRGYCSSKELPAVTTITVATLLSAACFALYHENMASFPQHFVFGIVAAEVYRRSGNIYAPMLMHGLFNFAVFVTMLTGLSM